MKEIFLIIIMGWGGSQDIYAHKMPNMQACRTAVLGAKIKAPTGADQENIVAMFCAYDRGKEKFNTANGAIWK